MRTGAVNVIYRANEMDHNEKKTYFNSQQDKRDKEILKHKQDIRYISHNLKSGFQRGTDICNQIQ